MVTLKFCAFLLATALAIIILSAIVAVFFAIFLYATAMARIGRGRTYDVEFMDLDHLK